MIDYVEMYFDLPHHPLSGRRNMLVLTVGPKWARLLYPSTGEAQRMKRAEFDRARIGQIAYRARDMRKRLKANAATFGNSDSAAVKEAIVALRDPPKVRTTDAFLEHIDILAAIETIPWGSKTATGPSPAPAADSLTPAQPVTETIMSTKKKGAKKASKKIRPFINRKTPAATKTPAKKRVAAIAAEMKAAADAAGKNVRDLGKRAVIEAAAAAGKLPDPPDFSAKTHERFLPKLDLLKGLVATKDVKGLKAFEIKPISSSPKALDRWRNLCVIALEAQAKAA